MKKLIITAGPTIEKIDPVRYISNYSSGKQGYAIAEEFAKRNYEVILISGPVTIAAPDGVQLIPIGTADEMLKSVKDNLPADIAIFTAAVCDWKPKHTYNNKLKKSHNISQMSLELIKTPDILYETCKSDLRPKLVIGFAAETENIIYNAKTKLQTKKCDIIIANDVRKGVFGSNENQIVAIDNNGIIGTTEKTTKKEIAKFIRNIIEKNSK